MVKKAADLDVIIIGGGPGGLSAGLWCADLGLSVKILEKGPEFGGQLLWTFNLIENFIGIDSTTGTSLRDRFLQHAVNRGVQVAAGVSISNVDLDRKIVNFTDGTRLTAGAIIIATGVRRRKLGIPGEEEFQGLGILESGVKDREAVRDKSVVIVGGGDAALENALILSETARLVTVVHRSDKLSSRASFTKRAKGSPRVNFIFKRTVATILGNAVVHGVEMLDATSSKISELQADAVLIRIGTMPNTEILQGQIEIDDRGYICVDRVCATSMSNVFAIGDVANPVAPTVSSATGMGATAAKAIYAYLGEAR